jgi:hypothetical protein
VLDARRATIATRPGEIFEELGHAVIERRSIVATGLVAERRSQPAFADAGRPKSARLLWTSVHDADGEIMEECAIKEGSIHASNGFEHHSDELGVARSVRAASCSRVALH